MCPREGKCAAGRHKKHFNVSYLASELTDQNAGFTYLKGTCGGGKLFEGGIVFTRCRSDVSHSQQPCAAAAMTSRQF